MGGFNHGFLSHRGTLSYHCSFNTKMSVSTVLQIPMGYHHFPYYNGYLWVFPIFRPTQMVILNLITTGWWLRILGFKKLRNPKLGRLKMAEPNQRPSDGSTLSEQMFNGLVFTGKSENRKPSVFSQSDHGAFRFQFVPWVYQSIEMLGLWTPGVSGLSWIRFSFQEAARLGDSKDFFGSPTWGFQPENFTSVK